MKVASIIVNHSSKSVDREFDYLIPEELNDYIRLGMKVIVPFGQGNKPVEGFVMSVADCSGESGIRYKTIQDIGEQKPVLDEATLQLARFIRETWHSTFIDAIRLMLPPGTALSENLKVKLLIKDEAGFKEEALYRKFDWLLSQLDVNRFTSFDLLVQKNGKKLRRAALFELASQGVIEISSEMEQSVGIKKVICFEIENTEAVEAFLTNASPKLKKQAELLRGMLVAERGMTLGEIEENLHCGAAVVKALVTKGLLKKTDQEVYRDPFKTSYSWDKVELSPDQKRAIEDIVHYIPAADKDGKLLANIHLLRGVTGCGKTEIYMALVEKFLMNDAGSIILVPEIALTPQTVDRFKGRFGDTVAVLHSRLSDGERYDQWRRISRGEVKVVVGARSAVFAPVQRLKLIVLDEEHEYSYKSESSPRYVTHEVAKFRTQLAGGMLILGSATPSIESYYKAISGEYHLVEIDMRIDNLPMPEVEVVDLREELRCGNRSMFSRKLICALQDNLEKGDQTILFLNKRGHSTFVSCRACGYKVQCSHCDVTMTYHAAAARLVCHYCGSERRLPVVCPECGSKYIKHFGIGTEKVEEEAKRLFPDARVLRMDLDTTRRKGEHEKIYRTFKEGRADILIGTQMISKGMDFKDVTLVGVIAADTSLNIPDFRSGERTFQLLSQVGGRAGRGLKPGKVIIQTYDPEHAAIGYSTKHDYKGFYQYEIKHREWMNNPPFTELLHLQLLCEGEQLLIAAGDEIATGIRQLDSCQDFELLGPTVSPIPKIKNNFRRHIILKGCVKKWYNEIEMIAEVAAQRYAIKYIMDINPYSMM